MVGGLALLGMIGIIFGAGGLLIIGLFYGLPCLILMIPFLLGMIFPLVVLTALHPGITANEEGLRLKPLIWKASELRWENLVALTDHSLIPAPPPDRQLRLRKKPAQVGYMIIVQRGALGWPYRLVGVAAGHGLNPIFAISNKTHTNYEALAAALQDRLPYQKDKKTQA
jgi:hypothetical protein